MSSLPRTVRVLAVDDEPSILNFVQRVLTEAGYQVETATNGGAAVVILDSGRPFDLLLTDLVMPAMAGDELARHARQREPDIKVLYLTGFADRLFKERMALWESEAFLDKPCSIPGLLEAVSLLLFGRTRPDATADDARGHFFTRMSSS